MLWLSRVRTYLSRQPFSVWMLFHCGCDHWQCFEPLQSRELIDFRKRLLRSLYHPVKWRRQDPTTIEMLKASFICKPQVTIHGVWSAYYRFVGFLDMQAHLSRGFNHLHAPLLTHTAKLRNAFKECKASRKSSSRWSRSSSSIFEHANLFKLLSKRRAAIPPTSASPIYCIIHASH